MSKRAILLINLGSPDSPDVADVRRYLAQFLMDPAVIDVPLFLRWLIVYGAILPTRPARSAEAYASVWTSEGSPLLVHSYALQKALAAHTGHPVFLAMRYGNPAIPDVLSDMRRQGVTEFSVVPLYPHYAMSSTGTAIMAVHEALREMRWRPQIQIIPPFYNHPGYIRALVSLIRSCLPVVYDHVLFSYHGLPERHIKKADSTGKHCMRTTDCCAVHQPQAQATCYRHQVFETTRLVSEALGISSDKYSVSFQSRLGRDKWLLPFTDPHVEALAKQGVKHLVVTCPAFVADCLETLEEIGEATREKFLHAGGETFTLLPCLNDYSEWVSALGEMV